MTRKEEEPPVQALRLSEDTPADPLRQAQRRCQLLGEAAARDTECLRTWAETRDRFLGVAPAPRSEEHTSELQSLMRISYAVFCLKKKKKKDQDQKNKRK